MLGKQECSGVKSLLGANVGSWGVWDYILLYSVPDVGEFGAGHSVSQFPHTCCNGCNDSAAITQAFKDNDWNTARVKKSQNAFTHSLDLVMRRGQGPWFPVGVQRL